MKTCGSDIVDIYTQKMVWKRLPVNLCTL